MTQLSIRAARVTFSIAEDAIAINLDMRQRAILLPIS